MSDLTRKANEVAELIQFDFRKMIFAQYRKDKYTDKMKQQILLRLGGFSSGVVGAMNDQSIKDAEKKYKDFILRPKNATFKQRISFLVFGKMDW
jgi:hypothetical protein